jgi:hypothetical protein
MTELERKRLSVTVDLEDARRRLAPERRNGADAMLLLMRLDQLLEVAIADRNRHEYRRVLRVRRLAARRLERRYNHLTPRPSWTLGAIRRAAQMPRKQSEARAQVLQAVA